MLINSRIDKEVSNIVELVEIMAYRSKKLDEILTKSKEEEKKNTN